MTDPSQVPPTGPLSPPLPPPLPPPPPFPQVHCRNCNASVAWNSPVCPTCGTAPAYGRNYCYHCGSRTDPAAVVCVTCGVSLVPVDAKSRTVAGILGILLGGFGVHRFYLGYTQIGVIQIVVTVATCGLGQFWGMIEGILILVGNDQFRTDAFGRPLRD